MKVTQYAIIYGIKGYKCQIIGKMNNIKILRNIIIAIMMMKIMRIIANLITMII